MELKELALSIATETLSNKGLDRDGKPVILHSIEVARRGITDEEYVVGMLHDVVEDTTWTFDDLLAKGIPEHLVDALRLLTHDKSLPYNDYVQRIIDSRNPLALRVKYNDLSHNFERGKAYPDLQAKHGPALAKVRQALEELSRVTLFDSHSIAKGHELAIFACGCFWGAQHQLARCKGVVDTWVGYTGGKETHPTYEQVRHHQTHHVEAVAVEFDPSLVSYEDLCKLFFEIHDPAQLDGSGPDIGPQYLSRIFYRNQQQYVTACKIVMLLRDKGYTVNTLLLPATDFWIGEGWHQDYYEQTGGTPYCHIRERKF